jgi:hypothetical protein
MKTNRRWLINKVAIVVGVSIMLSSCGSGSEIANVLTGGDFNGATARQLELAKKSRVELCCSITIVQYDELNGLVNGCGQQASYKYINSEWNQQSVVPITGWGSPDDRLAVCTQ